MTSKMMRLTAACMLAGSMLGWQAPAIAGSDASSDTYAGDYQAGSLPTGTFIALQYAGFAHANAFVDTAGNKLPDSHGNTYEEFTRFAYFAKLFDHPFVIEAEIPTATLGNVNVPGTNNLVKGGFTDPVFHLTYFFISDARTQRWLGITDYSYLPIGDYDNTRAINVATAHQYTNVPQIGYTEGLEKFSPAMKGWFFDFIGNASFHTDGKDPINVPGPFPFTTATYGTLTQTTSYDVKAFMRYAPKPLTFVALGIEKSWGGEQIATNGTLSVLGTPVAALTPQSLSKDDYLRGHLQFEFPLARDLALGGDIFHDFDHVGGFKDDIGFEFRLTKFFLPQAPSSDGLIHK